MVDNDRKQVLIEKLGWAIEVFSIGMCALQVAYQNDAWSVALVALGSVCKEVYERLRLGDDRHHGLAVGISAVPCALASTGRSLDTIFTTAATLIGGPLLGIAYSRSWRGVFVVASTMIFFRFTMTITQGARQRSGEAACGAAILSLITNAGYDILILERIDESIVFVWLAFSSAIMIAAAVGVFFTNKKIAFIITTVFALTLFLIPPRKSLLFWLTRFLIHPLRLGILCAWSFLLFISIPLIGLITPSLGRVRTRKLFHILAVILFAPVTYTDPILMAVAYGIALALFIWLEAARIALPKITSRLSAYYQPFLEAQEGPIALSHIYLLFGCAAPHALALTSKSISTQDHKSLLCLVGVIVLGISDAAAAICGITFGTWHWPHSERTLEGSFAFFLASIVSFSLLIKGTLFVHLSPVFILTVIEATTSQTDNLVLPLYAFALYSSSS